MAIYTLSKNYIDGIKGNQSHYMNVLMKFPNPDSEHKAAMDTGKKLLLQYIDSAKDNADIQTWLDFMSRDDYFERININIPNQVSDEDMYLMIAEATRPFNKIIVDNFQHYSGFKYINGTNKVKYNNCEIQILDKIQAFKDLQKQQQFMETKKNNPWSTGSFYLVSFIILILVMAVVSFFIPWYAIPLVFIAGTIASIVVNAFQLKNDEKITDKSFLALMSLSIRQLILIRSNKSDN